MTHSNFESSAPSVTAADDGGDPATAVATMRLSELGADDYADWRRLADRAAEPNPFHRPEFVDAVAKSHAQDPLVLVVKSTEGWLACLPVTPVRSWRRIPARVLAPWRPDLAFVSTPLVDRDHVGAAADALAGFVATSDTWGALVLGVIDPGGVVGTALLRAFADAGTTPLVYRDWERAALRRRPQPTYVEEALSSKRRKELRRLRRGLERETGSPLHTVDQSGEAAAWDEFLDLECAGWKGEVGTALASTPEGAASFRAMCAGLAADDRLQILSLRTGDRTVAMQCNMIDGEVMFAFKVAYDPALGRFSPGTLLEVDAIQVFHDAQAVGLADSCAEPDSEFINRLWPDRLRFQTLIVPTGSWRAAPIGPTLVARRLLKGARARVRTVAGRERRD